MSLAETAQLAVQLDLKGNLQSGLANAERGLSSFNSHVSKLGSKLRSDLGGGLQSAAHNIERMGVVAAGFAVGAGAAAVKWAGDFQAGMETINTVALTTPEVLGKAGAGLRSIFRETGQSMTDLQSAEYDLVSAGVKLADAQTGVSTAVHLGIGALGSTSEAVDVLTTAINSYNLKAKDGSIATGTWARISDELAQAVADGKVKLSEIAATYATVAPTAAAFGVKTGEIAAALGFLTAKGNPAAQTLTQMNRAIIELVKPKGKMADVLKSLGTTGEELIRKNGLGGALEIIRERADKLHLPFQDLFGRIEAYKFALQTTGPNAAGFNAELQRIAASAGMTNKQFDERAQGFNYQLGVLKANVTDAGITIGTALLPKLTEMATAASGFLRGHQQDLKDFATELAGGFERAASWAEKLDWAGIAGSVKTIAGFGKSLAQGFLDLPPDVRNTLAGLFALNKLSGGAVIKIGIDVAGGLASGLAKALGSTLAAAGIGKLFVQPVFVTNAGFGAGGGGLGGASGIGALGVLGAVGISAALLAVAVEVLGPPIRQFALEHGLAGSGSNAGKTDSQLAWERMHPGGGRPGAPLPPNVNVNAYNQPGSPDDRQERHKAIALAAASASANAKTAAHTEGLRSGLSTLQQRLVAKAEATNANLGRIADRRESTNIQTRINIPITVNVSGHIAEAGGTVSKAVNRSGQTIIDRER